MTGLTNLDKYIDIVLDFADVPRVYIVKAHQNDMNTRFVRITPHWQGNKMDVGSDITPRLSYTGIDNQGDIIDCIIKDGKIIVELTASMLSVPKLLTAEISLYKGGQRLSSVNFQINISADVINRNSLISDAPGSTIPDMIIKMDQTILTAEAAIVRVGTATDVAETSELLRVAEEQVRVTAENSRITTEQGRVTDETTRIENEAGRAGAEASRNSAEANRNESEAERYAAENTRVRAEAQRINNSEERIAACDTAASSANTAAEAATEAVNQINTLLSQHADQPYETAAGESLHFEDSAGGRAKKIEFGGNARQGSTKGINKINSAAYKNKIVTSNGVTFTADKEGIIILNGTVSDNTFTTLSLVTSLTLKPGTYTMSQYATSANCSLIIKYDDIYQGCSAGVTSFTINTDKQAQIYLQTLKAATFSNLVVKPILVEGTYTAATIPAWEPFSGGIASPNPLYPQKVEVVKGPITGKIYAKNMFTGLVKGIAISTEHGGTYTSASSASSDFIQIDITKTFFLSGLLNTLYSFVAAYDADKNFVGRCAGGAYTHHKIDSALFTMASCDVSKIKYIRVTQYQHASTPGVIADVDNARIQLEVGTNATAYEPCYGQLRGGNLFSGFVKGKMLSTSLGSEYTSATAASSDYIQIDISKTYYLSGLLSTLSCFICAYDADKNYVGKTESAARSTCTISNTIFTYNTTSIDALHIKYIRITQYEHSSTSGKINDIDSAKIQLYECSAMQTYSIPLIAAPVENLFTGLMKGISVVSATGQQYASATAATSDYIEVDPTKTYFLSGLLSTLHSIVAAYDGNKNYVGKSNATTQSGYIVNATMITTNLTGIDKSNIKYIRVSVFENAAAPGKIDDIDNAHIKLHEGSYAPHEGAIELCKVKDAPDKITYTDGLWGVDKPAQKIVFNGQQNYVTEIVGGNRCFRYNFAKKANTSVPSSADLMCTHYKAAYAALNFNCYIASYGSWIYMYDNRFETVAERQTWDAAELAAGHPVEVYYLLNEPERIVLCDEAQTALNALAAASLPGGTVNMMTSNDPAPTLELEYRQDLKAFIVKVINETLAQ